MHAEKPRVVIDVVSAAVWIGGVPQAGLAARYRTGAGIRALAWWLEEALDG